MDNVGQSQKRRKIQGDKQPLSTENKDTPSNDTIEEVSENIPFKIVSFEDLSSEIKKNNEKNLGHPVHYCIFENYLAEENNSRTIISTFKDKNLNISEYDRKTHFYSFLKSAYEDQHNSSVLVPKWNSQNLKHYMKAIYKFNKDIIIYMVNKYPWRIFLGTFKSSDISEKILNDLYLLEEKTQKAFIFSDSSIKFVIYVEYFIESFYKSKKSNISNIIKYNFMKKEEPLTFKNLSKMYYDFMNNKALFEKMNKQ